MEIFKIACTYVSHCASLTYSLKDGNKRNNEKELKKGNGEKPDEGYAYRDFHGQRCMNDCSRAAVISHLN